MFESLEPRVVFDSIGPDGFGYIASNYPYEAIDLIPGDSGVVTLLGTDDDATASISLSSHTFNFYGQVFTGSNQLFVSTNGLITFGSGNDAYQNADLTSSPPQRSIAPHWDDLNVDSTNTDSVLYKFDDANARLIVEWNMVSLSGAGALERVTFQAFLSLDTSGASPIIFNYPDLDVGQPLLDDAGRATVGIKDLGTQGADRLLISYNSNSGFFAATGQAIRIATTSDTTAPKVTSGQLAFDALPQKIAVSFDEDVSATLSLADVTLFNQTSAQNINTGDMQLSYSANTATITFPGLAGARLPDGNYTLSIASAGVSDAAGNALDGDGNGSAGGDYQLNLFFLSADANRDRFVDTKDFNLLAASFGGSSKVFSQGNFNYDSAVDSVDFGILLSKYGVRLAMPASSVFASVGLLPDQIEV